MLHRAEGYAALSTIEKHRPIPRLLPSLKTPTQEEIWVNMNQLLNPKTRKPPSPLRDSLVDLCWEHCNGINLHADSYEAIEAIRVALEKKCHLGKDGTVLAIAPVTDREQYNPVPLILSPLCKKETGANLKVWLQLFMMMWQEHPYGEALYRPIYSLAKRSSVLGQVQVCRLPGLNHQTGSNYILGTCDYKHVFKHKCIHQFLES
ncbi:hypothetical protein C8R42DRAFT_695062 [Lentinula raphanica]|nr:hypothetical protein C8R42DRAFT_695062 [Lentinula raphanica]